MEIFTSTETIATQLLYIWIWAEPTFTILFELISRYANFTDRHTAGVNIIGLAQ